ncbi:unnamed protein product [Spirodela intermedia]|uniref:Uncharacterized protein n=1 Tax=Spirodela intermedia TaxID=51605 RepID=A0A7I8KNA4_SPIIN|nr:unnamed protein product [Spirodela intermedia]
MGDMGSTPRGDILPGDIIPKEACRKELCPGSAVFGEKTLLVLIGESKVCCWSCWCCCCCCWSCWCCCCCCWC